jgi:2,3-bisphosphoglycerate-independent phosphoglycerate mutase
MFSPLILIILDGWGIAPPSQGNAIFRAKLPIFNELIKTWPVKIIQASGEAVGLMWGEPGNSEVGHLNLGAGKIVYQILPRINQAIVRGEFTENQAFKKTIEHVKSNNSSLHLIGLLSSGGVHSLNSHLYALLEMAKKEGLSKDKVCLHLILDGRDRPFNSGLDFVNELIKKLEIMEIGEIASLSGRFWAMDRDNHWERTEKVYQLLTEGKGPIANEAREAIERSYKNKIFDEEFEPTLIQKPGDGLNLIKENDAVIFFNFREDRARQLTKAFVEENFSHFQRTKIKNLFFTTMTEYEKNLPVNAIAFPPEKVNWPLSRLLAEKGISQLHIAETEKYAHVTFFFNGGKEEPFPGEKRILVPSPRVSSYALKPEMSAKEVADKVLLALDGQEYSFIIVNFANPDMVGHTGDINAAISALETIDNLIGDIVELAQNKKWSVLITADHGNVEEMINFKTGEINKEHSTNPVPFIVIAEGLKREIPLKEVPDLSSLRASGILSDVSPTILKLMGLPKPEEMTGTSLI